MQTPTQNEFNIAEWTFPVPPVCTAYWTEEDWKNYVVSSGKRILKPATSIVIIARRWFQRTYGNTYHSCRVIVDGVEVGYTKMTYGYGEQYLQTALEILQASGYRQKTGESLKSGASRDYCEFMDDMREHREKYVVSCSDVERQKDL